MLPNILNRLKIHKKIDRKNIMTTAIVVVIFLSIPFLYDFNKQVYLGRIPNQLYYPDEQLCHIMSDYNMELRWHPYNNSLIVLKHLKDDFPRLFVVFPEEGTVHEINSCQIYDSLEDITKLGLIQQNSICFNTPEGLIIYNVENNKVPDIFYIYEDNSIRQVACSTENRLAFLFDKEQGADYSRLCVYDVLENKPHRLKVFPDRLFSDTSEDTFYFSTKKRDVKLKWNKIYDLWKLDRKKAVKVMDQAYNPKLNDENIAYYRIDGNNMSLWAGLRSKRAVKVDEWPVNHSLKYIPDMAWVPGTDTIIYTTPDKYYGSNIFSYDLNTGAKRMLQKNINIIGPMSISQDGEYMLYFEEKNHSINIHTFKLKTGRTTNITDRIMSLPY